ncbi:poly(3-hydroxybutyrate) depolymerase [Dongia mobilis]|uniref:Poly(3-hydroxybutyrate) depolymerase n=1 Tax=Dongia mobilis TaxID=578943 RepID=A0A4V3DDY1_9PROT|nr:polyhydroxyalkanoate depolymerase [Dongia mobilis]TDQ78835.1 poly(3-hydroxybutyrate) depolymerase [Dongia mobilis]
MLYHAIEAQYLALTPLRIAADAWRDLLAHPHNPLAETTLHRAGAAAWEILARSARRHGRPEFGIREVSVDGIITAVSERVVMGEPFCRLIHFERALQKPRNDPKVLLVAPLSGHFATLVRDTIETLLTEHEVYVTDWQDAREVPLAEGAFGFEDYVDVLIRALRHLGRGVSMLAICQPAPAAVVAASMLAEAKDPATPRHLILMGGPVDTRKGPTEVTRLAKSHSLATFDAAAIHHVPPMHPGAGRRVYPGLLQLSGFMSLNPDRHLKAHLDFLWAHAKGDNQFAAAHRRFYEEYLAVMDLDGQFYLDTVRIVFQQHALATGRLTHHGQNVAPGALTQTGLMTIEGGRDDITGAGQCHAAHALCTRLPDRLRLELTEDKVGHYGLFSGRKWRERIYPAIRDFIRTANPR